MGWFYGFKLHLIVNDLGELLAVHLTQVTSMIRPLRGMTEDLFGKLFGDKGYLSSTVRDAL